MSEAPTTEAPAASLNTRSARPRRAVTLRDLFWLILAIGVGLGAYRWGFQAGRDYREPTAVYAKIHYLPFKLDAQGVLRLQRLITSTIEPDSWSDAGGPGSLSYFDTNQSLVISNRQSIHERVTELMGQLKGFEHPKSKAIPGNPQSAQEALERWVP